MYEALLEFPEGWEGGWEFLEKIPSMGEVWVFSGITHFIMSVGTKVEANN